FTATEKLRVLKEADGCTRPGELGALLRREGLYSSHLSAWRAARQRGELAGLAPRARGPKAKPVDPRDRKLAEQAREITRLQGRLERAEGLIAVQKNDRVRARPACWRETPGTLPSRSREARPS